MIKKLTTNADYYPTEALRMAYVNSCVDKEVYKHLTARSKISAQKLFATAEEMFEILQKAYKDVNWKHTAMKKFRDLKMTKDFNSFWAEFQVLTSKLDHNESMLITELKYKLTLLLSWTMTDGVSQSKDLHKYAQQCQLAYQDLKDIELQISAANFGGNQYQGRNTNTNTSIKTAGQQTNRNKHLVNSVYSRPSSIVSNLAATCLVHSKATRFTCKKIAKLQHENCCFPCKKVSDHWPKCSNR